jgi:hypothetical protein
MMMNGTPLQAQECYINSAGARYVLPIVIDFTNMLILCASTLAIVRSKTAAALYVTLIIDNVILVIVFGINPHSTMNSVILSQR